MKQVLLLFIASVATLYGTAQNNVGIGTTTPDASSRLEINSNNSGLLIPRLTAVQRIAISSPANGLLVFDTDSAAFAYRTGGAWFFLKGTSTKANGWSTTGNAGTNAANFIGTTDAQPLLFKVKNQPSGFIDSTSSNTAFGFKTLFSNTSGLYNTATGYQALTLNTTGYANTANGVHALSSNTTGGYNTANGYNALQSNTTGSNNIANGSYALYSNTTGSYNTANGYEALSLNTTGYDNIANGFKTLVSNTTGYHNTANGNYALYLNTTGNYNTANGYQALNSNLIGYYNTAIGDDALYSNTTGYSNIANGFKALYLNTTGGDNTANGNFALQSNTTGNFNTALGALANVQTGSLTNATAIGYNAVVNASNKIRLGNAAVTVIEGQVAYTYPSDGRFKINISENVKGLDFIIRLRPIVYNFQTKKYEEFLKGETNKDAKFAASIDYSASEKIRHNGFIAQEVEKAAKESGYEFDGVVAPANNKEAYGLSYSQFVVPLVKAVQELNANNKEQQQMIEGLKTANETLKNESAIQKNSIADLQKQIDELKALIKK